MKEFKIYNPYNNDLIGGFTYADWAQVDSTLTKLQKGHTIQENMSPYERSVILKKLADLILANKEELAVAITKEIGKTINDSYVEVERAYHTALISGEEAKRIDGEVISTDAVPPKRDKMGIVTYQPVGTVLGITPFNFPLNLSLHKLGPAFAAGNSFFYKPSSKTYLSAKLLTDLCYEAGMPEETLQLCMPISSEISKIISDERINCISFTGGVETANIIAKSAGYKRLLIEAGGNDPLIVMADADIDKAVTTLINQRFGTAGQRCTACKRIYIQSDIYNHFRDNLLAKSKKLIVGDPMNKDTFLGPVVSEDAAKIIEQRINNSITDGATLLFGGQRKGAMMNPTILEDVPDSCEIVREETFGPVIPLRRFSNIEEIIPIINGTGFGLQAGVFTDNLPLAKKLYKELEVGTLIVNDGPGFRAEHLPFGGVKNSGLGKEGVRYTIREMCNQKMLVI